MAKHHRMLRNREEGTLFMWTPLLAVQPNMEEVNWVDEEIEKYREEQRAESAKVVEEANQSDELDELLGGGKKSPHPVMKPEKVAKAAAV